MDQKEPREDSAAIDDEHGRPEQRKRIILIGNQQSTVDKVTGLVKTFSDHHIFSCTDPAANCMAQLARTEPDVLIIQNETLKEPLDPFLPNVTQDNPTLRVLVFGTNMTNERLFRLIRAGAHGYINGPLESAQLQRALESVCNGGTWAERHIMERFISTRDNIDDLMTSQFDEKIEQLCTVLSQREIEILGQVVKGLPIKQIAEEVKLSHQGVKLHLSKLFRKFNVANRNQLILATIDAVSPIKDLSSMMQIGMDRNREPVRASA